MTENTIRRFFHERNERPKSREIGSSEQILIDECNQACDEDIKRINKHERHAKGIVTGSFALTAGESYVGLVEPDGGTDKSTSPLDGPVEEIIGKPTLGQEISYAS